MLFYVVRKQMGCKISIPVPTDDQQISKYQKQIFIPTAKKGEKINLIAHEINEERTYWKKKRKTAKVINVTNALLDYLTYQTKMKPIVQYTT